MAKRQWKNLNTGTPYTFTPSNGWSFSLNGDGSATLTYTGSAAGLASNVDLTVSPDPGGGDKYPPTGP